ncbi:MAG: hypothetical protein LBL45_02730 [Treponema sp.]|nr:hypothetical protein [Treponema sp.]
MDISTEDFSTSAFRLFFRQWNALRSLQSDETANALLKLFDSKLPIIKRRSDRLLHFPERRKSDASNFYITRGDAGGNMIADGECFYLVDWDSPVYAPPERDSWFCLRRDRAVVAFHKAFRENGIEYRLRPERLAYYCYKYFFACLTFYLESYFDGGKADENFAREVIGYFNC